MPFVHLLEAGSAAGERHRNGQRVARWGWLLMPIMSHFVALRKLTTSARSPRR